MILTAIRLAHYLAGIAWVGATLVLAVIVFPAIDRCDGAVRAQVMRALARRIAPWETVAAVTLIVSGGLQAWRSDRGMEMLTLSTTWGRAIALGAACAVAIVVLGLTTLVPLTQRFTELEEEVGRDPLRRSLGIRELGRLDPQWWGVRRRLVAATTAEVVLAVVAVGTMAVARGS